ncbi:putative phytanoyl- dioxygenase family protein [Botrytis fragariae]|uniref:Putative phytanoyl- dioxygenase family protein n=1 Tax=Botrytis fragariae TaxID=1964551 RepID=A0A8H6AQ81_9HELO|nr:putative phytanoyl- dioxygenase family protein [Botrytis fragariae]KAF5871943.1 putative phytanoyl- dioxygenase family protein [Botrytis fragariae]
MVEVGSEFMTLAMFDIATAGQRREGELKHSRQIKTFLATKSNKRRRIETNYENRTFFSPFKVDLFPHHSTKMTVLESPTAIDESTNDNGTLFSAHLMENNGDSATDQLVPVFDALESENFTLGSRSSRSDAKKAFGVSQPSTYDGSGDGPLLLALLMGNNNNNANAAAQPAPENAVSDTLNPNHFALELTSAENGEEEIDNNPSSIDGEDGPLLFGLLLNNQNNNNGTDPRLNNARPSDTLDPRDFALELKTVEGQSADGEDGPLLLSLTTVKTPTKAFSAVPDTLDPRSVALELKSAVANDNVNINESSVEVGGDGPLLFALLLNNQNNNNCISNIPNNNNNNNNDNKGAESKNNNAISDTLDPRIVALELKPGIFDDVNVKDSSVEGGGEDGPLLFTLMLSQNTNPEAGRADVGAIPDSLSPTDVALELPELYSSGETITEAIPDVLEMKTQLLELHPSKDAITEAIPDVLEMKTQLLELHSPGDDEANSIPIMLKVNSQAQKAQILAMLQGRSIPIAIASNGTNGVFANETLDRAQVTAVNLQFTPHVALNEAKSGNLSDEQLQFWRENGYLVIPDTLSDSQKDHLLKTVHEAAQVLAGGGERVQKHAYLPGQKSYVSPVGRAIATLSEHGFNPDVEPLKRIQRIGCGIHRVMPPFRKAILSPFHSTLAKSLGYKDPRIYQSLIIVKAAEVGARVIPHQDGCSGFTNPSSCTTFWYALEDCSTENGCLAVAPGSHRVQPITRRCITNGNGQPEFTDLEKPVYAHIEGVDDSTLPKKNEKGEFEYKKLEVKAGTLVLMHGNLMHKSEANQSSKSRVAFNFGVVEGEHGWLEDNYLQPCEGTTAFENL